MPRSAVQTGSRTRIARGRRLMQRSRTRSIATPVTVARGHAIHVFLLLVSANDNRRHLRRSTSARPTSSTGPRDLFGLQLDGRPDPQLLACGRSCRHWSARDRRALDRGCRTPSTIFPAGEGVVAPGFRQAPRSPCLRSWCRGGATDGVPSPSGESCSSAASAAGRR